MKIPASNDVCQYKKHLSIPEIRVWCHPGRIGKEGGDYYHSFDSFTEALDFIKEHKEAETCPLIAFRGKEINLFAISETDV